MVFLKVFFLDPFNLVYQETFVKIVCLVIFLFVKESHFCGSALLDGLSEDCPDDDQMWEGKPFVTLGYSIRI